MPKDYFAGSDGKTLYISHGERWNKARKDDRGYCFTSHDAIDSKDNSTLYLHNGPTHRSDVVVMPIDKKQDYKYVYSVAEGKWITLRR